MVGDILRKWLVMAERAAMSFGLGKVAAIVVVVGVLLASVEAFARLYLGLGHPPLSIPHPTIEYMFRPNQDVIRFGNHVEVNEFGMRSPPWREWPNDAEHIPVLGDSVINGGNLTDQADLATSILSNDKRLLLNISAGSWGPQNMLAYVDVFGTFNASRLVIVLSSHDAGDVPGFGPLNPLTHPTEAPVLATWEGATRYLPRYIGRSRAIADTDPTPKRPIEQEALDAVTALVSKAPSACVVLHYTRTELRTGGERTAGLAAIAEAARGATIIDDSAFMRVETSYLDDIHLTAQGQKDLSLAMERCF